MQKHLTHKVAKIFSRKNNIWYVFCKKLAIFANFLKNQVFLLKTQFLFVFEKSHYSSRILRRQICFNLVIRNVKFRIWAFCLDNWQVNVKKTHLFQWMIFFPCFEYGWRKRRFWRVNHLGLLMMRFWSKIKSGKKHWTTREHSFNY